MARLILSSPDGQRTVELRTTNSLGRHPENSIQVLDKIVSKNHCIIEVVDNQFILRDLGSLNGTYVNGARVEGQIALAEGADIALGQTRARFEGAGQLPQRAPTPVWNNSPQGFQAAPAPQTRPQQPPAATADTAALPQPGAASAESEGGFRPLTQQPVVPGQVPSSQRPVASGRRIGMQTRVDMNDNAPSIGKQIDATNKGFVPYEKAAANPGQLQQDYERLRLSHELSREIALERDLEVLLGKILETIFRFVRADRGVIFLRDDADDLVPGASLRRDGTDNPIPVSSTIMSHVVRERATVLTHDAAMDFAASKGKSMILNRISSAIVAPLLHDDEIVGVLWLDSESLAQFQQKDLEIVTAIANQAAMFIEINILGKKIEQEIVNRERFSRLLSPNVAERVLSGELKVEKGGQSVDSVTVFNSDIRGFTAMSEKVTPEELVDMLNEYFERMVETLFKFEGTLDKFMGDGIMALWGAPATHPDDAIRSVQCALEQIKVLKEFNAERVELGKASLDVGFGIHTGPLVAGYIGSSKALSYTVIGDTANTSARLCGVAESGQIVVSEATLALLRDQFHYEELPPAHLKNKAAPFRCFNITGPR
ncbi:MAG: FHA domain-containing protein [Polyangiaceae bacterium]|nr:FHA domain-containing protein [Polyangiaceae bacterium]